MSIHTFDRDLPVPAGANHLRQAERVIRVGFVDLQAERSLGVPACPVQRPMHCDYAMSRRLRSGSRSARKGSRDRNASAAWRLAALARLVFRSALTPEHAEGG